MSGWRKIRALRSRNSKAAISISQSRAAQRTTDGFATVLAFGLEEGSKSDIPPQEFALVVGEPTRFRFFSSSVRREDRAGDMIDDSARNEEFEEVAPIETTLSGESGKLVPVNLQAVVTEVGTLELRCLEKGGSGRWKLELNVRGKEE